MFVPTKNLISGFTKINLPTTMTKQSFIFFICFFQGLVLSNSLVAWSVPRGIAHKADEYKTDRLKETDSIWVLKKQAYAIQIAKRGFRYSILKADGTTLLPSHAASGLVLLNSNVVDSRLISRNDSEAKFTVTNDIGIQAVVHLSLYDHYFKISVSYTSATPISGSIIARTQGLAPAYGLADNAAFREPHTAEVSGFTDRQFGAKSLLAREARLISNFVIFPKQGLACINIEPDKKIIKINDKDLSQGSFNTSSMPAMYYFIGDVKQIYADYLQVRNKEGYKVYLPKYSWFGVGWEAWGALEWNTNFKTVSDDVDRYIDEGFPLSWMVVGSGFWPNDEAKYASTTSFGAWDRVRYPDPKGFINHFHKKGLKFIIGLRIAFIPNGLYTNEGITKGYFLKKDGIPYLFKTAFPKTDCYFLDASNPSAVNWYDNLCKKWEAAGVDGFKEDLYGYETRDFKDNKLDPVNRALMNRGVYVMGRNGYVGSPMDLHRYNDFNYPEDQDRGPVNGLSFAYSGFPYVYPDVVGGTRLGKLEGPEQKDKAIIYLMRGAQYAAVNPSMSFGYGPWNFNDELVLAVCRSAAQLHERLHPYIYSAAVKTYLTGFPYSMTPLPLAYPADSATYYRENAKVRGYQWLLGEALLAAPLYGNDYHESNTRDIYLPAGKWIDYDSGKLYEGQTVLKNFNMPVDKTPLFVGGTGLVIEKIDGKLKARIYPVGFKGKTEFYDQDSKIKSDFTIKIHNDKSPVITDMSTGKSVKSQYRKHAYEFAFIPGHNYKIE